VNITDTVSHPSLSRSLHTVMTILDFDLLGEITDRLKKGNVSVLDIGCGVGRSLWELSDNFPNTDIELTGIFYSEKPDPKSAFFINEKRYADILIDPTLIAKEFDLSTTNRKIPKLINIDATKKISIKSNSIDLIYSTNAFHFFIDKIGTLREISRILKINGIATINIDRTDEGFWPNNLHFPRLQIHDGTRPLDAVEYLTKLSGEDFHISTKLVNSYGKGYDSHILTMKKLKDTELTFTDLKLDTQNSYSLDNIRFAKGGYKKTPEYIKLMNSDTTFTKDAKQEYFGGYLSSYALKNI
jgi:SAM-dependent methyltransferase